MPICSAGKTKHHLGCWKKLTTDRFILECVTGSKISFTSQPTQVHISQPLRLSEEENKALRNMIKQLEIDGVIEKCEREDGDYVNNVFLREKKYDCESYKKYRMILNVKELNKQVEYVHFKMDTLESCLNMMDRNCFMASIDLSNAYHAIPMHSDYTKYFKFQYEGHLYKYLVLPQGFRDSPRLFTKIMKPVLAHLHDKGYLASLYIDDFYLQGATYEECLENVSYTSKLVQSLGFEISSKSVLIPSKQIIHLGFSLNSEKMTISLSQSKAKNIRQILMKARTKPLTVRKLSKIIGILVACFPAVEYGRLFYRHMEMIKIKALKLSYNFEKTVNLSLDAFEEIEWWLKEGLDCQSQLTRERPCAVVQTDSSGYAWGAVIHYLDNSMSQSTRGHSCQGHESRSQSIRGRPCKSTILSSTLVCPSSSITEERCLSGSLEYAQEPVTSGMWSYEEQQEHINVLELKAAKLGIQSLCQKLYDCHVRLEVDNTTAVSYINNMGGTRSDRCNSVAKDLILWCKERKIWLTACHIAGKDNTEADRYSRKLSIHTEWQLDPAVFSQLCHLFGKPEIDLFAARTNHQLPKYMSLYPDPNACAINAFYHSWDDYVYIFPPFNLIHRILKKLKEDKTRRALVIVPVWKMQPWYTKLEKMIQKGPVYLKNSKKLLQQPSDPNMIHPLYPKLQLMACVLSGIN